ncbi:MAG: hypothetical protein HY040_01475 [Planctomycetes bacterium]|nr:hypothetical protein [Planctomycetota bacterium]
MKKPDEYTDIQGRTWSLDRLDAEERKLVARIRRRRRETDDWDAYDNFWTHAVPDFYRKRGLAPRAFIRTIPYRIAQDLSSRLAIEKGFARPPDLIDELEDLIRERFGSSSDRFCKATGLAKHKLEKILDGGNDLALSTLNEALNRIGYTLHIAASVQQKKTG